MKTKTRFLLVLAVVTLLLTACRVVVDTKVQANGSGELRTAVVFSAQERQDFEQKPENESKSICGNLGDNVPEGATFVEEIHDGETYCVTERSFASLAELRNLYGNMSQVTVNTLELESGKFTLDLDVDLTGGDDSLANEWQITLPGAIGTHNADRVIDGQTLVWEIEPGQKGNLHAESVVQGVNPPALGIMEGLIITVLVAGCVIVLVVLVVAFLILRNRRKPVG